MNRLILADNQAIFRAGAARVMALEDDMSIVAQCESAEKLFTVLEGTRGAIVLVASSLHADLPILCARAGLLGNRIILVAENTEHVTDEGLLFDGVVCRNVAGADLVDCVRRVA